MFLCIQHPLADVRPLLALESFRTLKPTFQLGYTPREFVRSVGSVRKRVRGAPADWPAEDVFCDARSAYRFRPGALASSGAGRAGASRFRVAFRRYFSNGETVSRLETGLARATRSDERPLAAAALGGILRAALELPVRVSRATGQEVVLSDAGPLLARQLLNATTRWADAPDGFNPTAAWISAGAPLAIVEYAPGEIEAVPQRAVRVEAALPNGARLHHMQFAETRVWLLEVDPRSDRRALRDVRLHLLRLNAEREAIRRVLRLIAAGDVPLEPGTYDLQRLIGYLERTAGFLRRESVYGHDQSALLRAAYGADDLVAEGDRRALAAALDSLRGEAAEARAASQIETAMERAREAGGFPL